MVDEPQMSRKLTTQTLVILLLVIGAGALLRLFLPPVYIPGGADEKMYAGYVKTLDGVTLANYPALVRIYIFQQETTGDTKLPPTRFLYIASGYAWHRLFHQSAFDSLHAISCIFSILVLPLTAVFAFRLGGGRIAIGTLLLTAFSPLQIYVSRHALIDGVFGFWALLCLWLLWENLRKPRSLPWLAAYTAGLALLVITKENAFFVFVAIVGIFAINRRAKFGAVNFPLVVGTLAGGAIGVAILALLSGGLDTCMKAYLVLTQTASHFYYSIATGDGPWYRYLYDLMLVNPLVLILAVGAAFQITREKKAQLYLLGFVTFSYLVMCNIRYGMNLRYANMWDMPLRYLAFCQLDVVCSHFQKRKALMLTLGMVGLCYYDMHQYYVLFVDHKLYELITRALTWALRIVK